MLRQQQQQLADKESSVPLFPPRGPDFAVGSEVIKPQRQKMFLRTCPPSKDSDQPAHAQADLSLCWADMSEVTVSQFLFQQQIDIYLCKLCKLLSSLIMKVKSLFFLSEMA